MVILLSGQGEYIFPSNSENVSLTVYTAAKDAFNMPPDADKFNYLGSKKNFLGTLWYDSRGKVQPFGGKLFKNEEITKLIDLKKRMISI